MVGDVVVGTDTPHSLGQNLDTVLDLVNPEGAAWFLQPWLQVAPQARALARVAQGVPHTSPVRAAGGDGGGTGLGAVPTQDAGQ